MGTNSMMWYRIAFGIFDSFEEILPLLVSLGLLNPHLCSKKFYGLIFVEPFISFMNYSHNLIEFQCIK